MMKTRVCHGDSLTEASELDRLSIGSSLVENRLKIKVINSSLGGDTTGGLLSRFYPGGVQHRPDFVLIMGGTNGLRIKLTCKICVLIYRLYKNRPLSKRFVRLRQRLKPERARRGHAGGRFIKIQRTESVTRPGNRKTGVGIARKRERIC